MHTLNLRLAADEIGWIAAHAQDRFLIVDDILLPLYKQVAKLHAFEKVIVFPFSGAPVPGGVERRAAPSSTLPPGEDAGGVLGAEFRRALRAHRRHPAHLDRQVLEAEVARDVPALKASAPVDARQGAEMVPA